MTTLEKTTDGVFVRGIIPDQAVRNEIGYHQSETALMKKISMRRFCHG